MFSRKEYLKIKEIYNKYTKTKCSKLKSAGECFIKIFSDDNYYNEGNEEDKYLEEVKKILKKNDSSFCVCKRYKLEKSMDSRQTKLLNI